MRWYMRTALGAIALSGFLLAPVMSAGAPAAPDDMTVPMVRIDENGKTWVQGLYVMQKANTTLYARTSWDKSIVRWLIKTGKDTDFQKRFGDPTSVGDIAVGDYLTVEGYIEGGTSLSIVASSVIDWSDYTSQSTFRGTVSDIQSGGTQFTLARKSGGPVSVSLSSTGAIYRNKRELLPKYLQVGDVITSISGTFDALSKKLVADRVDVYIDPNIFVAQNYQGTLKTLPAGSTSGNFTLAIGGKDYTIVPDADVLILNTRRQKTTFSRFLAGDTVRVYGYIRPDNDELDTINVSVVRDINF